jgi:hypothetical protein
MTHMYRENLYKVDREFTTIWNIDIVELAHYVNHNLTNSIFDLFQPLMMDGIYNSKMGGVALFRDHQYSVLCKLKNFEYYENISFSLKNIEEFLKMIKGDRKIITKKNEIYTINSIYIKHENMRGKLTIDDFQFLCDKKTFIKNHLYDSNYLGYVFVYNYFSSLITYTRSYYTYNDDTSITHMNIFNRDLSYYFNIPRQMDVYIHIDDIFQLIEHTLNSDYLFNMADILRMKKTIIAYPWDFISLTMVERMLSFEFQGDYRITEYMKNRRL